MAPEAKYKWIFISRFRRHAFGWRSQTPIKRIKEAVSEIKKIAKKDPALGGEGAVLFLERVSAAIEQVDGSSGAIGAAVNNAIFALVPIIAMAPVDDDVRGNWLERLWNAVQDDEMAYIEMLTDYWGDLCVTPERASKWADDFIDVVKSIWSPDSERGSYFAGTTVCFGSLLKAGRYDDILDLLETAPHKFWHYHQWGVKALAAKGEIDEALSYAENSHGLNDNSVAIAWVCEEILLANDRSEDAYRHYAIPANQKTTYLATFRAIRKKYPNVDADQILDDLISSTPGEEGKWFAAALSAELFHRAVKLANLGPCNPITLTNATRKLAEQEPLHAIEYGMAALFWLVNGYGYEITGSDVGEACNNTLKSAKNAGLEEKTVKRIRYLVAGDQIKDSPLAKFLFRCVKVWEDGKA